MAKTCYENSLSVNPTHVSSLHRLGWVNHVLGFDRLAEQSLKAAVRIDPHNDRIWSLLGEIKGCKHGLVKFRLFDKLVLSVQGDPSHLGPGLG